MNPRRAVVWHGLAAFLAWQGWAAPLPTEHPLDLFLPNEETITRLRATIERLESESFAEREAASRELAALPSLPGFIRELATTETRAESRYRLRKLVAIVPVKNESQRLAMVLETIKGNATKGQFDLLCQLVRMNSWSIPDETIYGAARATVAPEDFPLVKERTTDASPLVRRIAAAALAGLPPEDSTALLAGLLKDSDAATVALAVAELAVREDRSSLPAFASLLDSPDFQVRHRCHAALLGLTKQEFGYDPGATEANRRDAALKWQQWVASGASAAAPDLPKDQPITLFNGDDLQGWEVRAGTELLEKNEAWEAWAGELICKGRPIVAPGDLWSIRSFENFVLNLEYRASGKGCDGGIGLMLTKEGEAGDGAPHFLKVGLQPGGGGNFQQVGKIKAERAGEPIGALSPRLAKVDDRASFWHKLRLTVRDGTVVAEINGIEVNRTSKGPRGPGRIVIRNEGCPMSYRNLQLLPLGS